MTRPHSCECHAGVNESQDPHASPSTKPMSLVTGTGCHILVIDSATLHACTRPSHASPSTKPLTGQYKIHASTPAQAPSH